MHEEEIDGRKKKWEEQEEINEVCEQWEDWGI